MSTATEQVADTITTDSSKMAHAHRSPFPIRKGCVAACGFVWTKDKEARNEGGVPAAPVCPTCLTLEMTDQVQPCTPCWSAHNNG